jgi:hypothetical protein
MYTFGKPYARGEAILPGKCVRVLKIEGKCSCLRAKAAHISGHLPLVAIASGNLAEYSTESASMIEFFAEGSMKHTWSAST